MTDTSYVDTLIEDMSRLEKELAVTASERDRYMHEARTFESEALYLVDQVQALETELADWKNTTLASV